MMNEKEIWLKKALYNYRMCQWFYQTVWWTVSAETLRTFLKRPLLSISITAQQIDKNKANTKDILLHEFSLIHENSSSHFMTADKKTITELIGLYEKGISPEEAAIEVVKDCDTREEAEIHEGEILSSGFPGPFISAFCISASFICCIIVSIFLN